MHRAASGNWELQEARPFQRSPWSQGSTLAGAK